MDTVAEQRQPDCSHRRQLGRPPSVYLPGQSHTPPNGTVYNVTDDDLLGYQDFPSAAPFVSFIFDLNFRVGDDPYWAVAHAKAVTRLVDQHRVRSFE